MILTKEEKKIHSDQVIEMAKYYKEIDEEALFTLRNMLILFENFDPDEFEEFEDQLNNI